MLTFARNNFILEPVWPFIGNFVTVVHVHAQSEIDLIVVLENAIIPSAKNLAYGWCGIGGKSAKYFGIRANREGG